MYEVIVPRLTPLSVGEQESFASGGSCTVANRYSVRLRPEMFEEAGVGFSD